MSVPFPLVKTANEARQNMLYWAYEAERTVVAGAPLGPGLAAVEKCKMYAVMVPALPEGDYDIIVADDSPIRQIEQRAAWGTVEEG